MRKGPDGLHQTGFTGTSANAGPCECVLCTGAGWGGGCTAGFRGELVSPLGAVLSCWHVCVEQLAV